MARLTLSRVIPLVLVAGCTHSPGPDFVHEQYTKAEYRIPMRDGVKLFTTVYVPKDASEANRYPILLKRTVLSAAPYGDVYGQAVAPVL
jgi:predicted acyl esterase